MLLVTPVDVVDVDAGEGGHLGDLPRSPEVRVYVGVGVLRQGVAVELNKQNNARERERTLAGPTYQYT